MSGFSVILVPTDWLCPTTEALAVARSLARRGARLIVLPVDAGPDRPADPTTPDGLAEGDPPVLLEYARRPGPPVEAILGLAEEVGCELIVVGAPENGATTLGCVAQELLRRAICPVVCLPAPAPAVTEPPAAVFPALTPAAPLGSLGTP